MPAPGPPNIRPGDVIADKYRIVRELGRGGMATVYEAEHQSLGKKLAIKVLSPDLTSSTTVVERFLREARAAAAVKSSFICEVYDTGRIESGPPYLVLEHLEGESLYEHMTRVRQMDVPTTLTIISQTCRALARAHGAGIVHRDLKPENIFLTKDPEGNLLCKLLDFGLAKFYESSESARLTREGAVFGTPAYMSPEQVRGQNTADQRADLWALACITYECFTGQTVWSTEQGVAMTFAQIASAQAPDPRELRADLPAAYARWLNLALHRSIDRRPQTPQEFTDTLLASFAVRPPKADTPTAPWNKPSQPIVEDAATIRIDPSMLPPGFGLAPTEDNTADSESLPTAIYDRPEPTAPKTVQPVRRPPRTSADDLSRRMPTQPALLQRKGFPKLSAQTIATIVAAVLLCILIVLSVARLMAPSAEPALPAAAPATS